jgi:hypothetical protein
VARRVCNLENLVNEDAIARVGLQRHVKKKIHVCNSSPVICTLFITEVTVQASHQEMKELRFELGSSNAVLLYIYQPYKMWVGWCF